MGGGGGGLQFDPGSLLPSLCLLVLVCQGNWAAPLVLSFVCGGVYVCGCVWCMYVCG